MTEFDVYLGLVADGMIDASQADTMLALHVLVMAMNERGVMLLVDGDEIEFVGPSLPAWCEPIVQAWWDLLLAADAGRTTSHHLYACDHCGELMLIASSRTGRSCSMSNCPGKVVARVPLHFLRR